MAIFGFFMRKSKLEHENLQKKLQDAAEHLGKVLERIGALEKLAAAIENRQKEMVIQLEELDASINEDSTGHFEPLMSLADINYDFYCYSKKDEAIAAQAKMMWQGTTAALLKAGIEVLLPNGCAFNYNLHIAHGTTSEPSVPHECITETLKCGYIHGDIILRRATVIVNKTNGGSPDDSWH